MCGALGEKAADRSGTATFERSAIPFVAKLSQAPFEASGSGLCTLAMLKMTTAGRYK